MPNTQQFLNTVNHDPVKERELTARQTVRERLAAGSSGVITVVQVRTQTGQLMQAGPAGSCRVGRGRRFG